MNCWHEIVRRSATFLLSVAGLIVASTLTASYSLASAESRPVTIGGPFTLTASDGTTVTDQTYRGKWLLVFLGTRTVRIFAQLHFSRSRPHSRSSDPTL